MAKTFAAKTRAKIETATETVDVEPVEEKQTGNARKSPSDVRKNKVSVCMNDETYGGICAIASACHVTVSTLLNNMVSQYVNDHIDLVNEQLEREQKIRAMLNVSDAGSEE